MLIRDLHSYFDDIKPWDDERKARYAKWKHKKEIQWAAALYKLNNDK